MFEKLFYNDLLSPIFITANYPNVGKTLFGRIMIVLYDILFIGLLLFIFLYSIIGLFVDYPRNVPDERDLIEYGFVVFIIYISVRVGLSLIIYLLFKLFYKAFLYIKKGKI